MGVGLGEGVGVATPQPVISICSASAMATPRWVPPSQAMDALLSMMPQTAVHHAEDLDHLEHAIRHHGAEQLSVFPVMEQTFEPDPIDQVGPGGSSSVNWTLMASPGPTFSTVTR